MSNQIKLTIDLSDELVDKLLTVMAITSQKNALQGAMPMLMGAMGGATPPPPPKGEGKPPMGFNMEDSNDNKTSKEKE